MDLRYAGPQTGEKKGLFLNPLIRKISDVRESSDSFSTYSGILGKIGYFMLMVFAGIALALVFRGINAINVNPATDELFVADYAVICILAAAAIFLIFPFLAFILRKTIPVTGAGYCIATGYLLGFMMVLDAQLLSYMMLALVLTVSIVIVMGVLYFKGYIHISDKFRAVTKTLFATMVTSSLLMFICSFIPVLREGIMLLADNLVLSIGASVGGVIIATLFLLIDFETVKETVEHRLPKQYEWYAAFGLFFTIVWLYFKVLDLVMKVKDSRN